MTEQDNGFKRIAIGDILPSEQCNVVTKLLSSDKGDVEVAKALYVLFSEHREQLEAKGFYPLPLACAMLFYRDAFQLNQLSTTTPL